ncbi:MAG: nucleotidyl transferase AbiEii/AbiGii toxin family protein [Alphaproteobacteria bacterium]|nr:nucleotidyl transferase AbiEii/AbiGii toxin family protein [Alphaproteobacteria bacterium]
MKSLKYKNQLKLLIDVLPSASQEDCFALHGGTAINLFVHNMPRISVDIDLTYLPIEDRQTTLKNIGDALLRIKNRIESVLPHVQIISKYDTGKLVIRKDGEEIKLEVNLIGRGTIEKPSRMMLCEKAQQIYDVSADMQIVPFGQLYGGKICAALDRQHPRDLFDIKILLENNGFSDDVRKGFLMCLLCSDRPINEVIFPNFQDQRNVMENQFKGMSDVSFTYDDFERSREQLIQIIRKNLTAADKEFLLSVKNCEPDWSIHDFERFPAVQWKLHNLQKLKTSKPEKHKELYEALKEKLEG